MTSSWTIENVMELLMHKNTYILPQYNSVKLSSEIKHELKEYNLAVEIP